MADEIVNRVANSKLITIDLEDCYPEGKRVLFDIKDWLFEGLVLREKDFREKAKTFNWEQYKNCYVALTCSTEAIVPAWAYMLLVVYLEPFVEKAVIGDLGTLETSIYQDLINQFDTKSIEGKPVIIKGCSNKPVPVNAYTQLINKIKPYAKSIMYGEACSSVPLFKNK